MLKLEKLNQNVHELRKILINAIILSKETEIDSELVKKRFTLTQFGASCVLYMMKNEEYCPELEQLYTQNILRGKNNTEDIIFIENIEPYEIGVQRFSDTPYETRLSYVSMGFAKWVTFEDARQRYIDISVRLMRYRSPYIATIAEMIKNRDEEGLLSYFEGRDKKEIIQYLKGNDFSDDAIEVVLEIVL